MRSDQTLFILFFSVIEKAIGKIEQVQSTGIRIYVTLTEYKMFMFI